MAIPPPPFIGHPNPNPLHAPMLGWGTYFSRTGFFNLMSSLMTPREWSPFRNPLHGDVMFGWGMPCNLNGHVVDHLCQTSGKSNQSDIFPCPLFGANKQIHISIFDPGATYFNPGALNKTYMLVWKSCVVCQRFTDILFKRKLSKCLIQTSKFREATLYQNILYKRPLTF